MKKSVVLSALLALLSFAPSMAPCAAEPAANRVAAEAPGTVAQFLASLSGGQAQAPADGVPAPSFLTGCSVQCAWGEICCYLCGNPPEGDDSGCWGCVEPVKDGGCPQVY
jgi:hypothetical protein